jgi:hypothetical protein
LTFLDIFLIVMDMQLVHGSSLVGFKGLAAMIVGRVADDRYARTPAGRRSSGL